MKSVNCASCGLVNFATDDLCKRCKANLKMARGRTPRGKIKTECPRCDSENTQSFQMAYQTGTSFGQTSMVGVLDDGGIGVARAKTSGQTVLASRVKPPMIGGGEAAILTIFGVVTGAVVAIFISLLVGILVSGIFGVIAVSAKNGSALESQDPRSQEALKKWQRSWICLKCGNTWQIRA